MVRIIRWKCSKCGRKWIHPVEKCIYDGEKIAKVVTNKVKVVGFTKIFIPNPLHPIVPYNVIMLEDELGNRMPKKTMKDYNIGDVYQDIPDSSDSAVAIVKLKYDFYEAVSEAIELTGGLKLGKSILIKPNMSIPGHSYLGMCTNPKVIDALLQYLIKDKGAKPESITIAEQNFFMPFEESISKSGLVEVAKKHKVKILDLSKTEFIKKKERDFEFEISKAVFDAGLVINVPVIKTDMVLGIDGAFENMIRFLSKKTFEKYSSDPQKAALALAVFPKVFPPFFTLGDASIGLQGNGPANYGEPGFFNLILAARNPVVHDTAVKEIFCLRKVPYVELAAQLGYGQSDASRIKFIGNELEALRRDIKQPIGSKLIGKAA
ncbi:DUF362 domain-containing protein [Candidatus Woesearchaeota archaeon]|nr:DUF362 domain-containing protein [Candidatus Woesearchaeota archaeon]